MYLKDEWERGTETGEQKCLPYAISLFKISQKARVSRVTPGAEDFTWVTHMAPAASQAH